MAAFGLTSKQELLAAERAKGATLEEGAATLGVAERTAYRWAAEPAFKDRVRELQDEALEGVRIYLRAKALAAAKRLVELQAETTTEVDGRPVVGRHDPTNAAAVRDHLDRVGLKPPTKIDATVTDNSKVYLDDIMDAV